MTLRPERFNGDYLRGVETGSIRRFVEAEAHRFSGKLVLDYGCGREPYRDVIEVAGGTYEGYDSPDFPATVITEGTDLPGDEYGAILCTQVIQYVDDVTNFLGTLCDLLEPGGALVMTGPLVWPEVEPEDLHRLTRAGVRRALDDAGFSDVQVERRGVLGVWPGFDLALGWQAVARA